MRRVNAAAAVVRETLTGTKSMSPADAKTVSKEELLGEDAKRLVNESCGSTLAYG